MSDDELTPFRDEPLLSALRAPASETELAGEDAARAMFRSSQPARSRRRRAITRATVGGTTVILGLTLTGGVAAAYTKGLPDSVQDLAHAVIAPLPVPAPPTAERRAQDRAFKRLMKQLRSAPRPLPIPSQLPLGVLVPRRTPSTAPSGPAAAAPRTPTPTPSATASAAPPTWSVEVSRRTVPVHGQVVLFGRLARDNKGLPDRQVYAAELPAGASTWRRVASGRTASDGTVTLTVPPLTSNVRLRLVSGQGVVSRQLPVTVVPQLTVSQARSGGRRIVTITADGGYAGNTLVLLRRDGDAWTRIASTSLSSDATGSFTVPGPGATRVRYLVRLPATARHGAAAVEFVVAAR
jgi:hypothetical protein